LKLPTFPILPLEGQQQTAHGFGFPCAVLLYCRIPLQYEATINRICFAIPSHFRPVFLATHIFLRLFSKDSENKVSHPCK